MLVYLSVHDIVWINATIAGENVPFDYEKLEAAMASQYSYGDSTDVRAQSANMLASFASKPPFAFGNLRTAFVAVTAFLTANGYALQIDDGGAAEAMREVASGRASGEETIDRLATAAQTALRPGVYLRALVAHICNERKETLTLLTEGD